MPSHDASWRIERYPAYDKEGKLESMSYGCPDLNLMGYENISELCTDVAVAIMTMEYGEEKR